jgi:hypothetical protein
MNQLLLSSMFTRVGKEENQTNVKKIAVLDRLAQVFKKGHICSQGCQTASG